VIGGSGGRKLIVFSMRVKLSNIGMVIKQQRAMSGLTLGQLSEISGVSPSHLGRIERGERFPSAHTLRKIAKPLGFDESELFVLADYLPPQSPATVEGSSHAQLDHYVARVLAEEPVGVQRTVIAILSILKSISKAKE
jgi:transcriptional regulator with XRE-family HTH domain